MKAKITIAGLAVLAILAANAIAAAGAQAEVLFHDETSSSSIRGEQIEKSVFNFEAGTVECSGETEKGSQSGTTATEESLEPGYTGCESAEGLSPIDINGCKYAITVIGPPIEGEMKIVCPVGKKIELTLKICTIDIGSQTVGKVSYQNKGAGKARDVEKTTEVKLAYTQTGVLCPGNGGAKEKSFTLGIYKNKVTLKAKGPAEEEEGFWVE